MKSTRIRISRVRARASEELGGRAGVRRRATRRPGASAARWARHRSIAADEPDLGSPAYPVGGGSATEEENAPPVADPGPDT